jgi:hypothetical protein
MKYLLHIYPQYETDEFEQLPADEQQAIHEEYLTILQLPAVVDGNRLQPVDTATGRGAAVGGGLGTVVPSQGLPAVPFGASCSWS